jgi:hypothetical protein
MNGLIRRTTVRLEHEEHLKMDLWEVEYGMRIGFIWLRIGTGGGLLLSLQ